MYNMIFQENPASDWLLSLLGLTRQEVGRFRDTWVQKGQDGELEIAVYTRNGGNNRPHHMPDFSTHPLYLRDKDDTFDNTYATIYFKALPGSREELLPMVVERDPDVEWQKALDGLRAGTRPDIEKNLTPLVDKIATHFGLKKEE
jgi:hypothetical protein